MVIILLALIMVKYLMILSIIVPMQITALYMGIIMLCKMNQKQPLVNTITLQKTKQYSQLDMVMNQIEVTYLNCKILV